MSEGSGRPGGGEDPALRELLDELLRRFRRCRVAGGAGPAGIAAAARGLRALAANAACGEFPPGAVSLLPRGPSLASLGGLERGVDLVLDRPSRRLAVYGTLAPGRENARVLEGIGGAWRDGRVRGVFDVAGWGSTSGYPGLRWEPGARAVPVKLLASPRLAEHWERVDRFEGPEYVRVLVPVELVVGGWVVANLYEPREPPAAE